MTSQAMIRNLSANEAESDVVLLELLRIATEQPLTGAGKVSGLGYSIEGNTTTAQDWDAARVRAYQRLGFFEV